MSVIDEIKNSISDAVESVRNAEADDLRNVNRKLVQQNAFLRATVEEQERLIESQEKTIGRMCRMLETQSKIPVQ